MCRFKPVFLVLLCCVSLAEAQDEEALAKASQNPVADLISLPIQHNANLQFGPGDDYQSVTNIQPVLPFRMNENWNLITRTILPIVSQPGLVRGQDRETGLGDTTFTAFVSPSAASDVTWGAGPVVLLPTATDDRLGADEWGAGISAVVLTMPGNWVIGSLVSNIWDINGDTDINLFTWQYFINYNFGGGWYFTSAPIMTADWEADSDDRWTVPVGGGFGRVFRWGNQPLNANFQTFYNIEAPEIVGDWSIRAQLQLMFPK